LSLKEMGSKVIQKAMADAQIEKTDAVYFGNMLSGILDQQQQLGALITNEAGILGAESMTLEAACGSGGAALRTGVMAIMSGMCETVVVCGIEKMSHPDKDFVTRSIATASDRLLESGKGETFVTLNSRLMKLYKEKYNIPEAAMANFSINAHENARNNSFALFNKSITKEDYIQSKYIAESLKLYDASPICDGAAAIVLSNKSNSKKNIDVKITGSAVATETVAIVKRSNPLITEAIRASGYKAIQMSGIKRREIDFFETHDAYSIISALSLEAMEFAEPGKAWRLAEAGDIFPNGKIPISTFGGLKARGHALGASGVYQAVESYLQLSNNAGKNKLKKDCKTGLIQSIGGTGSTVFSHILQRIE
ncbi:MAG: thiolase C-terminal domain-containing protein, partial [Bacteroidota bacterium]